MDSLKEFFFNWIPAQFNAFSAYLYSLMVDGISLLLIWLAVKAIEFQVWLMGLSFDVAIEILDTLNFNEYVNSLYTQLPDNVEYFLNYLMFPQSLNLIITAVVMRFVMGKLGALS
jgi:hypothetical protein